MDQYSISGGPGTSSLFSLFRETGPYSITRHGKLKRRKHSWHNDFNLIFIDNPAGTGFSFTQNEKGYATDQHVVGKDLLSALQQFFMLFPHLQKNDFFLSGESYAGKYVPGAGYAIHQCQENNGIECKSKPRINLKGLAVASGLTGITKIN